MAKKKGRYAQKVEMGLVPFRYDRDRRGFGQVHTGPFAAAPKREQDLRKGRHRFVSRVERPSA
jgi:hypothetical protein